MGCLKAFAAGFVATLTFHQGLLALLYAVGASPRRAFAMAAVGPLKVPAVVSLAFWGGIWGIALWLALRGLAQGPTSYWLLAAALGALGPSLVAWFVVMPAKGLPVAGGWSAQVVVGALLLNGAWGIGTALFLKLFR